MRCGELSYRMGSLAHWFEDKIYSQPSKQCKDSSQSSFRSKRVGETPAASIKKISP